MTNSRNVGECSLENRDLKVLIDPRSLATHVLVKATGETLRMAGAQPDDILMADGDARKWKSFADSPIHIHARGKLGVDADLPALNLKVRVALDGADVLYEIAPTGKKGGVPREALYPRHFLLPRKSGAYATFPLAQGSIIPATDTSLFHHREGYSESTATWLGGFTGKTGYCGIPETPDDLYLAVDNRTDSPASVFIHWIGSLGELRYLRRIRYHFAADFGYVRQAKHYRAWCQKAGLFRSLVDKARENPNVARMIGAPILCIGAGARREKTMRYEFTKFSDLAKRVEDFRKSTGIKSGLVHTDGWGYWGYDSMHPDVIPPNSDCGGSAGLSELARRVKALGYLFALHDQYIDFYAHAPSFDEALSIRLENGRPVRVNMWCGGLCGHLCYTHIMPYLKRNLYEGVRNVYPIYHNSPSIWSMAKPTAYYLDCFCRTVECWSAEHPMTRTEARRLQNEFFKLTREGQDGEGIVLSVEHPCDFAVPYLDFGWSLGHFSADVILVGGDSEFRSIGIPVPLWHLAFHDALCQPSPDGDNLLEALLYAQAPYFWVRGQKIPAKEVAQKKVLLALHEDAAFAEMTDHEILTPDGAVQRCVYGGGLAVEVDKKKGTYSISAGKAKTKGTKRLG